MFGLRNVALNRQLSALKWWPTNGQLNYCDQYCTHLGGTTPRILVGLKTCCVV